jgi:DNA-binding transcriptional MerR regulator
MRLDEKQGKKKIGELAKRSGLSPHTIRYYERIGLVSFADRDAGGRRDYDESILVWIEFLDRLKTTGMPIREMQRYAALRSEGDQTGPTRRVLLERHRDRLCAHPAELQACLLVLDTKIDTSVEAEKRTQPNEDAHQHLNGNKTGTRSARS